jgi:uncharacterized protein
MFERSLDTIIVEALKISPIVLLSGARQVGKSTLAMKQVKHYKLFDDIALRESVISDAKLFLSTLQKPVCLDEVQKIPQILEPIKMDVDKNRVNGAYLLTGSASILDMQNIGDTLAGRIIEITLYPLSSKEINRSKNNIIDQLFNNDFTNFESLSYEAMAKMVIDGGYPEYLKIENNKLKNYWFSSYISTYIERDVRDIANIRDLDSFIRLFNLLAPRSANIVRVSELASSSSLNIESVKNYLKTLEMVYQIKFLKPYSSNISKRFIKSPKLFFLDSGLLSHLMNIYSIEEFNNSSAKGSIVETYIYTELLKHLGFSERNAELFHYRTNNQKEIDFILTSSDKIIAIEVKSSKTIRKQDFRHINDFKDKEKNFHLGVVFYMGEEVLPFGDKLYALPLSFLM